MKTIHKYRLEVVDEQSVVMPIVAKILCLQVQNGCPCIWAEVDPRHRTETRRQFFTFGTGHTLPETMLPLLEYVGTYQLNGGALVFHVYMLP